MLPHEHVNLFLPPYVVCSFYVMFASLFPFISHLYQIDIIFFLLFFSLLLACNLRILFLFLYWFPSNFQYTQSITNFLTKYRREDLSMPHTPQMPSLPMSMLLLSRILIPACFKHKRSLFALMFTLNIYVCLLSLYPVSLLTNLLESHFLFLNLFFFLMNYLP